MYTHAEARDIPSGQSAAYPRDIGRRMQTELILQEREEQLRLATEAAEVGLWDVDVVRATLYWPPRVKAMFGISPEVPVSMDDFYAGLHPEDRERVTAAFAAATDPQRRALYDVEYRTIGKEDGRERWVAAKGRGLFDPSGRCVRVIGTAIDITARKRSEAGLRGQQRILERIATGAPLRETLDELMRFLEAQEPAARCGILIVSEDGQHFRHGSGPTLPAMYHPSLEVPISAPYLGPCGEAAHRCVEVAVPDIETEQRYSPQWIELMRASGLRAVRSTPVVGLDGKVRGSLAVYYAQPGDPTPSDPQLTQIGTHLAAIALERARAEAQEAKARRALLEADRQKDVFLAMLAHELRNPLAPITSASEFLSRTLRDDPRAQSAIAMIRRQARQLTRLVDDLLDVSRITEGRIQLRQKPLDLERVIAQAIETVEPQLRERGHHLSVTSSHPAPLFVLGDFARLVQCLGNLLSNAVKYTEPGGQIRVETHTEETLAVLRVSDTGMGITPELLPRIFDLFVQNDRTLDRAEGGLGIGLAVVKRLVEMQQGTLCAHSAGPGQGASFEIRLPRIEPPGPGCAGGPAIAAIGSGSLPSPSPA